MLPFQSLSEVTSPAIGEVLDLGIVADVFAMQLTVTGISYSNGTNFLASWGVGARLEGSLDGENWYGLDQDLVVSGGCNGQSSGSVPGVTLASEPSGLLARYLRVNFDTLSIGTTNGTTPTSISVSGVSAWIAAKVNEDVVG